MSLIRTAARQIIPRLSQTCMAQQECNTRLLSCSSTVQKWNNPSEGVTNGFGKWDQESEVEGTGALFNWPSYNERVWKPDGQYRPAYVCHMRDNVKYTHKKMWHIAQFVRGLSVDEAIKQLNFINKKGAFIAAEVIEEARQLAVKEHCVEFGSNLWVSESFATKGLRMKGMRRHARMRMAVVKYDFMHYYVRLEEGRPPKDYWAAYTRPFNQHKMLEEWVANHRQNKPGFE